MVTLGHNVQTGYLNQGTWNLPEDKTALDAFLEVRNTPIGDARDYLARFLFRGDDVFKRVSSLSGGERTRLSLARLLITYPNVLVLDEPTTHLDIDSREALEETLQAYDGALLFVSHDRHFISLMAERLLVIEDGAVRPFDGGYEDWARINRPPDPQPVSRRARARHRRRDRQARQAAQQSELQNQRGGKPARRSGRQQGRQQGRQPGQTDYEALIQKLEASVATIERRIETASAKRDVERIERLARQHARAQKALENAWRRWSGE